MLDPRQSVYEVKGVTVITLVENRARDALKALATRNVVRHSLTPAQLSPQSDSSDGTGSSSPEGSSQRVTFAKEDQVKIMTPVSAHGFETQEDHISHASSPASSGNSTPSSEFSAATNNVAKTLTDRLSFWNRIAKRDSSVRSIEHTLSEDKDAPADVIEHPRSERLSLDSLMRSGEREPSEVLDAILSTTAPAPATVEQKNSELEDRAIRECVSMFSRGGMYFAYHFGRCSDFRTKLNVESVGRYHQVLAAQASSHRKDEEAAGAACPAQCHRRHCEYERYGR